MAHEQENEVGLDVCMKHGVWLDQAERLHLTKAARDEGRRIAWADMFRRPVNPPVDRDRTLLSPVVGKPMQILKHQGVSIDWSPHVGVWLDSGVLDAIINNRCLNSRSLRGPALRITDATF